MSVNKEVPYFEESVRDFEGIYHSILSDPKYKDNAVLEKYQVVGELYISTIKVSPGGEKSNLLLITSGLHGMEGYWGSVLLKEYAVKLLQKINGDKTEIILVHGINPWGMANLRRTNKNNVDLNRSFVIEETPEGYNSEYIKNSWFFKPAALSISSFRNNLAFFRSLVKVIATNGTAALGKMTLLGQYEIEDGIYFGGKEEQTETAYMKKLFRSILEAEYKKVVHIDLHTGYGPRYQMSIVNSKQEDIKPEQFSRLLDYPLVSSVSNEDFYDIQGDMTEYFYSLFRKAESSKAYYSTCFEFGTVGDSQMNKITSLRIMLQENSLHHLPLVPKPLYDAIKREFAEMYYPGEPEWERKAKADFEKAMRGVIKHFEL